MAFLNDTDLADLGLKSYGKSVLIDKTAILIRPEAVSLGDNVRIDAQCIISAGEDGIVFGSHIHIGSGTFLFGAGGVIQFDDFSGTSPGAKVFTASDDFSEGWLRGPQIDQDLRKLLTGPVKLKENAIIGAGSIVLPNVTMQRNSSLGALTVVSRDVDENTLVMGNPARRIASRDSELSQRLMNEARRRWASGP